MVIDWLTSKAIEKILDTMPNPEDFDKYIEGLQDKDPVKRRKSRSGISISWRYQGRRCFDQIIK